MISNVGDLKELLVFGQDGSLKYRLTADLDLTTEPNFYIPYLAGEFDGNNRVISNLSLSFDGVPAVALFGYLAPGGTITGLGVENANIIGTDSVGGLVGRNWQGTVSNSYSNGSVVGYSRVAGLVGWNGGAVTNTCSSGIVAGHLWVGGVTGVNEGTVADSYSSSSVTGSEQVGGFVGVNSGPLRNCYSAGGVMGEHDFGGLVGVNNAAAVTSSFWGIETSGQSTSDGGTGKTTAEMKSISTFSGAAWNIAAVANLDTRNSSYTWNIVDGQTYPFLSWQPVS